MGGPSELFYVIRINAMERSKTHHGRAAQKFARDPARPLPFNERRDAPLRHGMARSWHPLPSARISQAQKGHARELNAYAPLGRIAQSTCGHVDGGHWRMRISLASRHLDSPRHGCGPRCAIVKCTKGYTAAIITLRVNELITLSCLVSFGLASVVERKADLVPVCLLF